MNGIENNQDYRKYLTNYADQIMSHNLKQTTLENNCDIEVNNRLMTGNNPYLYHNSIENAQPYGYETSSLKYVSYKTGTECESIDTILQVKNVYKYKIS